MKHSLAPRRAFTLIEILVVIAIIGILSAILFPVLSRARENGRKTACMSNMKQLGLAFQQYAQDSRGKYPLSGTYFTGTGTCFGGSCDGWKPGNGHWVAGVPNDSLAQPAAPFDYIPGKKALTSQGSLFPYVKSTAAYICPSAENGQEKGLTYSMNCALTALSTSRITSPGDIVLLVDEDKANDGYFLAVNDGLAGSNTNGTNSGTPTNSTDALTKIHNGGGNLLFADGHAKFYPFESFPLDASTEGKANKWKTSGSPRFHDRAFGQWGSSKPSPSAIASGIVSDYCNATAGPGSADGKS